jgi:hypothetical protein
MSTTQDYQIFPDYYIKVYSPGSTTKYEFMDKDEKIKLSEISQRSCSSKETLEKNGSVLKSHFKGVNPRYTGFKQTHFTAGDVEQFNKYRDMTNSLSLFPGDWINKNSNIFYNFSKEIESSIFWSGYKNISPVTVDDTFLYLFHKFKKGIFVKILNNELKVFLPFSKHNFINEWGHRIKFDPNKYKNMNDFLEKVYKQNGYHFNPKRVYKNTKEWYANNCLLRFEYPLDEGDSGVSHMSDMFRTLCRERKLPDVEFFINRRDFPLLKRNYTEPYNHIYDSENQPLLSHRYEKYSPILGGSTTKNFADISIPTWKDWARVRALEGCFFEKTLDENKNELTQISWKDKIPTAVFRGSSTGYGVSKENNQRINLLNVCSSFLEKEFLVNVGITNWNNRPRKIQGNPYLQTISPDIQKTRASKLSPQEQCNYKYIINIDGHVTAFRLSLELSMGSVILLVGSEMDYSIWFMKFLKPYVHYVPVCKDLSNLREIILWCRDNDDKCEMIANNSRTFYQKYLNKNAILDYTQVVLFSLKKMVGNYSYNPNPLLLQFELEKKFLLECPTKHVENKEIFVNNTFTKIYKGEINEEKVVVKISASLDEQLRCESSASLDEQLRCESSASLDEQLRCESSKEKFKEDAHEIFIGMNSINKLNSLNFARILGKENASPVVEYIPGETFKDYLKSKKFNFNEYLFILLQICLALHHAQQNCAFVHWDLMPWNIIIKRPDKKEIIDYYFTSPSLSRETFKMFEKISYKVESNVIPVLIDYGKSHVVFDNFHYGFIKPFTVSTIQDILTILLSSILVILNNHILDKENVNKILHLSNFISNTRYRRNNFTNINELKNFISIESKFSNIIESNKYELEKRNPVHFYEYISSLTLSSKNFNYNIQKKTEKIYFNKYFSVQKDFLFNLEKTFKLFKLVKLYDEKTFQLDKIIEKLEKENFVPEEYSFIYNFSKEKERKEKERKEKERKENSFLSFFDSVNILNNIANIKTLERIKKFHQ